MTRFTCLLLAVFLSCFPPASAQTSPAEAQGSGKTQEPSINRSEYCLFRPVPSDQLRDFDPDRPSVTDGPFTIDPGHYQLEVGLVEYTRDRYNAQGIRLDSLTFADTNIRVGIISTVEIDGLFAAYTYTRIKDKVTGNEQRFHGFGDFTLRSKINLIGDDGGPMAIAAIPAVVFPTGANGIGNRGFGYSGFLPIQLALPAGFTFAIESGLQSVHEPGGGSHLDTRNSAVLSHNITKQLSTFLEFVADVDTSAPSGWAGTVDSALVYQPTNNFEVDVGANVGVTKQANDLLLFMGASWRY